MFGRFFQSPLLVALPSASPCDLLYGIAFRGAYPFDLSFALSATVAHISKACYNDKNDKTMQNKIREKK